MFNPAQVKQREELESKENLLAEKEKARLAEAVPALTRELVEEEKSYRRGTLSIKDLIAPAAIEINSNFFVISGICKRLKSNF